MSDGSLRRKLRRLTRSLRRFEAIVELGAITKQFVTSVVKRLLDDYRDDMRLTGEEIRDAIWESAAELVDELADHIAGHILDDEDG